MLVLLVALLAGGFARVEVKLQPLCAINMVWKYPFFFFFFLSERKSICSVCAAGLACSVRSSVQAQGSASPPGNTSLSLEHFWVKAFWFRCRLTFSFCTVPAAAAAWHCSRGDAPRACGVLLRVGLQPSPARWVKELVLLFVRLPRRDALKSLHCTGSLQMQQWISWRGLLICPDWSCSFPKKMLKVKP